jgi:predicted nucleic-acid-binding Zn-ribbon protein
MVHKQKRLILKCPKCGQASYYEGYPSDPQVSTVMCMKCGYSNMGYVFKRLKSMPRKK